MSKFARCFPSSDGLNVVCQHWNGTWIVFPGTRKTQKKIAADKSTAIFKKKNF